MSNWVKIAPFEDIPKLGARVVRTKNKDNADIEIGVLLLALDAFRDKVRDYPFLRLNAASHLWCKAAQS